ncbi:hypothetical protein [uncultured Gammaproteobacteria bacterium]|nr:hypothetical protein [uncultured Gammaproteobacteria bacterium]CAC9970803.1 hypothetical protein [uncultured Gammaproteobacteria bacterium]
MFYQQVCLFLSHLCGGKFDLEQFISASTFLSHLCGGKSSFLEL